MVRIEGWIMRDNQTHLGYYDGNGRWQRCMICLLSCGDRCVCGPPDGVWYSAEHDKRSDPYPYGHPQRQIDRSGRRVETKTRRLFDVDLGQDGKKFSLSMIEALGRKYAVSARLDLELKELKMEGQPPLAICMCAQCQHIRSRRK